MSYLVKIRFKLVPCGFKTLNKVYITRYKDTYTCILKDFQLSYYVLLSIVVHICKSKILF